MFNQTRSPFRQSNPSVQPSINFTSELKTILRMLDEAKLMNNEAIQKAVLSAGLAGDLQTLRALKQLIHPEWLRAQLDRDDFRPPPKGNEVNGDIHVGIVKETGAPFGLNLCGEATYHDLTAGCSGSGKTNKNRYIISQLSERGIPVFIADVKDDYLFIGKLIGEENLLVTQPGKGEFEYNPIKPPDGVPPKQWLQVFVDVFSQAFGLMVGSKGFLMERLDELYKLYGVYEGKRMYPSMFELFALLEKLRIPPYSREARFQESSLGRIKTSIITLEDVFDCSVGFPIQELIRTNWVLQLKGLAGFIQNFLLLSIVFAIFMYRISNNMRGEYLEHAIFLDEGKRLADKNVEKNNEISYSDLLISQIREFQTGIFLSDQEMTKISNSYKANTFTKFGFALRNGYDILEMARCMSLNRDQMEYFNKLQVGEAIVRSSKYPSPFIIQIPHVPV